MSRLDSSAVRALSTGVAIGLGVLWVVALSTGASFWLAWMVALSALGCFATVALVPERRAGFVAAANLGFIASILAVCWIVGLSIHSTTRWLTWFCFGAALVLLLAAVAVALEAIFDPAVETPIAE